MWLASVLALKKCSKDESSGISFNGDLSNIMLTIMKLLMVADEDDMILLINDVNITVHAVTKLVMLTSHALTYL